MSTNILQNNEIRYFTYRNFGIRVYSLASLTGGAIKGKPMSQGYAKRTSPNMNSR